MTLARELGLTVREESLQREALYLADELFMCGTAAEITPVRSVDRMQIGAGCRGPITEQIQKVFFGLFNRITSYNVCYTKLLRYITQAVEIHVGTRQDGRHPCATGLCGFHIFLEACQ